MRRAAVVSAEAVVALAAAAEHKPRTDMVSMYTTLGAMARSGIFGTGRNGKVYSQPAGGIVAKSLFI